MSKPVLSVSSGSTNITSYHEGSDDNLPPNLSDIKEQEESDVDQSRSSGDDGNTPDTEMEDEQEEDQETYILTSPTEIVEEIVEEPRYYESTSSDKVWGHNLDFIPDH